MGSNIGPEKNLRKAAQMLRELFPSIVFSAIYETAPQERDDQPNFFNAVAKTEVEDAPEELIKKLRGVEKELKKDPPYRFGPRTIDLDLLLYDDEMLTTDALTIPHPRMHERRFVLEPLSELIDEDSQHPVLRESWKDLLEKVKNQQCSGPGGIL